MHKPLLFLLAFACSTFVYGQDKDSLDIKAQKHKFYLSLGSGYTHQSVRDQGISPLRYDGSQATFLGELVDKTRFGEHSLQGRFDFGEITSEQSGASMAIYRGSGSYRYLRTLKKTPLKKLNLSVGGSFEGYWNLRQHLSFSNNAYNNEFYLNLGPSARAAYSFGLFRQKFGVTYTAQMPLVNYVVRPGFSGTYFDDFVNNQTEGIKGALKSGYFAGMKQYFRFQNELNLEYFLKGGNGLKLGYIWDYYSLKSNFNPINAGYRTIQLSLIYKF